MSQTEPEFVELPGQASSSHTKITELTPKQEALIPIYREKWREIGFSTIPIDRQKATEVVKAVYAAIGFQEPEVIFFDSPFAALKTVLSQLANQLESQLYSQPWNQLMNQLYSQVLDVRLSEWCDEQFRQLLYQVYSEVESPSGGIHISLNNRLFLLDQQPMNQVSTKLEELKPIPPHDVAQLFQGFQLGNQLVNQLKSQLIDQLWCQKPRHLRRLLRKVLEAILNLLSVRCVTPENGTWCLLDFCFSVLNYAHDRRKWEISELLAKECGCTFAFEKTCLVCDRPIKLSFDNEYRLHAEGEAAVQFADGYSLYSYHGVTLPEKYGVLYPHQWQAEWYLEEPDSSLRQLLIQVLPTQKLQSQWLLKEDNAELRQLLIERIGDELICQ